MLWLSSLFLIKIVQNLGGRCFMICVFKLLCKLQSSMSQCFFILTTMVLCVWIVLILWWLCCSYGFFSRINGCGHFSPLVDYSSCVRWSTMFVFFVVFTLYTNKSCRWFHLAFGSSMFGFEGYSTKITITMQISLPN